MREYLKQFILWCISYEEDVHTHPTQVLMKRLMEEGVDVEHMPLRKLGKLVGVPHPQQVKYHRNKVIKNL